MNLSVREVVRRAYQAELKPSTAVIIAMPALAVVVGLPINLTVVHGSFEWFGLLRILHDVSHRGGFWVFCLAAWVLGSGLAPSGHTAFSAARRWLKVWMAASAATLASLRLAPNFLQAGSRIDEIAFAIVLPGLALHMMSTPGGLTERRVRALKTLQVAGLTFVGCTLVAYGHTMVKGMLFRMCSPADSLLMKLDTALLGEHVYERMAVWRRIEHPQLTHALDVVYMELFEQQWWSFLFFFGSRDDLNGRRYILATFATYVLGSVCYYIAPSLGPLFYRPELFADCARLAPNSAQLARFLSIQTSLTQVGLSHMIAPFAFIAAFPSLHVGLALVVMLAMRRSRLLTLFNGLGALLTFVATVVLGWHYFVNGIFGVALGAMCWWLAVRAVPSASGAGAGGPLQSIRLFADRPGADG